ncbi:MAG: N-acetyltransferase [Gemmatimonadota bacterium]
MPQLSTPSLALVREVQAGQSLRPFMDLSWTINGSDPNWIPPLRMSLATALDRDRHPFHRHADVAYFVAEREGRPVGRIAAIVNHLHNEFHADRTGFFGLFECEDDPNTAAALFDAARAWLADREMTEMRGPVNLSTNDEISSPGILIEGFDSPPSIMMSHNPPYYGRLHDSAGFAKCKDVLAFLLDQPEAPPERGMQLIDRILARQNVTIRALDLKNFRRDIDALKEVYNAAWSGNWGFVPMTDEEFEHLAKEFRPIVEPELCLIAEAGSEPVGFYLALPNINEAFRHLPNGRLLPFGWVKLLWYKRKLRGIRVLTAGFKPRFHRAGIGPAFYRRAWDAGVRKGYDNGEASWVLEDNHAMIRAMEGMGGKPYKRYRIYEREL